MLTTTDLSHIHVPRYTSYPVITYWSKTHGSDYDLILKHLKDVVLDEIDVYVHLPFCESLCTYCGCNKYITKNHNVESEYLDALIKEWHSWISVLNIKSISNIHLGGGTPTFFSSENLNKLLEEIKINVPVRSGSFEAHPNYTQSSQLEILYHHGFRKISFGVQDFSEQVQKAIHRYQSPEQTDKMIRLARKTGYSEVNIDLVYGLPFQNLNSIKQTLGYLSVWMPETVSYFAYAHVPWKSKAQRGYDENDIPGYDAKKEMFEYIKNTLTSYGYMEIGMDHFARPESELAKSYLQKKAGRNFMGYVTRQNQNLLGIGCSSISDINGIYFQNEPDWKAYVSKINHRLFPVIKHHIMNEKDKKIKKFIMNLMCYGEAEIMDSTLMEHANNDLLRELLKNKFIFLDGNIFKVSDKGRHLIRLIASCFDPYFQNTSEREKRFSKIG
ncbi:MAG: oxygen-independent coproporphyrinogen III oxidase [Bacteroidia bacterium]|nr:oxygen-independent coproporphyrinogen III oxidase [Bacteroidia bacterium]